MRIWREMMALAVESQGVIGLRIAKIARGGPQAATESRRMVSEKVEAAMQAVARTAMGASPSSVVRDYRRKVRANAKRLKKG